MYSDWRHQGIKYAVTGRDFYSLLPWRVGSRPIVAFLTFQPLYEGGAFWSTRNLNRFPRHDRLAGHKLRQAGGRSSANPRMIRLFVVSRGPAMRRARLRGPPSPG